LNGPEYYNNIPRHPDGKPLDEGIADEEQSYSAAALEEICDSIESDKSTLDAVAGFSFITSLCEKGSHQLLCLQHVLDAHWKLC